MSPTLITALGIAAAVGTTSSFVPQAWKTFRTRSADDFSWGYLALFASGVTLWLIYGFLKKDACIIGANAVTLLLLFIIVGVKFKAKK